ncbi:MAG: SpoIID/LytB domain-containing protein [Candidatus Omnitrophota bacterium]
MKRNIKGCFLKRIIVCSLALLPVLTFTNHLSAQGILVKVRFPNGVISQVELEKYVCGVLAGEIPSDWPLEALKAMAVCARTFAVNKVIANFNNYYHLTSEVRDQVYRAGFRQNEFFTRAVSETRGEVLTYDKNLAQVYYYASSGGYTASSASVWGNDFPYLKAMNDPYSTEEPYNSWTLALNPAEFLRALKEVGDIQNLSGTLKSVEVAKRDESNRVKTLKVSLANQDYFIDINSKSDNPKRKTLREVLGNNQLRSTSFDVRMENGMVLFTGKGWGHGVGLSQWGAKKMAEQGYTYDRILKFYFPDTIMGEVVLSQ